jgi:uncharacterized repeat protein (TIGR02543 family)
VFGTNRVTSDITLYAKWTVKSYTVRFNVRGGSAIADITADYGAAIVPPANPMRSGFVFAGWFQNIACSNTWNFQTDVVTANLTLYAKWIN